MGTSAQEKLWRVYRLVGAAAGILVIGCFHTGRVRKEARGRFVFFARVVLMVNVGGIAMEYRSADALSDAVCNWLHKMVV